MSDTNQERSVLITGASGYIGKQLVQLLSEKTDQFRRVVAFDIRPEPANHRVTGVHYVVGDIRGQSLEEALQYFRVDTVIHLASIVTPTPTMTRSFIYSVDVQGSENVLRACVRAGVKQLVVTSSGAAYGYYEDNPNPLDEEHPLRGNPEFAYSDHKRQVEEMLAQFRQDHPELKQLVLRLCTVLGATTSNQITGMFHKRAVLGISGAETPFVFVWDQDVVESIFKGVVEEAEGIYNVAGDGVVTLREIAARLRKPYVGLPATAVRGALWVLQKAGVTQYGPEQVDFLRFRPVLSNARLKNVFGYRPRMTSHEALDFYLGHQLPDLALKDVA